MPGESLLEAYPLTWPTAQQRTPASRRESSRFKVGFAFAHDELLRELGHLGAKEVVLSSNVPLRRDGLPFADAREPADPGVAVYFQRKGKPCVFACDNYDRVKANIRAIGLTIAALRSIERYGSSTMLEQAFTGFTALPAHVAEASWWDELGISAGASVAEIEEAHRALTLRWHPDIPGGDHDRMARINRARDRALEERIGSSPQERRHG